MIDDLFTNRNRRTRRTSEAQGVLRVKPLQHKGSEASEEPEERFLTCAGEVEKRVKLMFVFMNRNRSVSFKSRYNREKSNLLFDKIFTKTLTRQQDYETPRPSISSSATLVESKNQTQSAGAECIQKRSSGSSGSEKAIYTNASDRRTCGASDVLRVHRDRIDDDWDVMIRDIKVRTDEPVPW